MRLVITYRKYEAKNGKPICISNGKSEIFTDNLTLANISGNVTFQPHQKNRNGSTAPLIIPITDEFFVPIEKSDLNKIKDPSIKKRIREQLRYRENHPIPQRKRQEIILN